MSYFVLARLSFLPSFGFFLLFTALLGASTTNIVRPSIWGGDLIG
jgi:hypothetical protein